MANANPRNNSKATTAEKLAMVAKEAKVEVLVVVSIQMVAVPTLLVVLAGALDL